MNGYSTELELFSAITSSNSFASFVLWKLAVWGRLDRARYSVNHLLIRIKDILTDLMQTLLKLDEFSNLLDSKSAVSIISKPSFVLERSGGLICLQHKTTLF